jgi:hypothetical protein
MTVPAERPRAPQYLLALQNELDEVRAHPPENLKTWTGIALAFAAGSAIVMVDGAQSGYGVAFVGLLSALFFAIPATFAARLYLAWRREIRRLERGIALFEEPDPSRWIGGSPTRRVTGRTSACPERVHGVRSSEVPAKRD